MQKDTGMLNFIIYNSHFFFKLFDNGDTNLFTYDNVRRWWKNVDIFSLKRLYFPVHIKDGCFKHWTLASIQSLTIDYYESLHGDGRHWVEGLMDYISLKWNEHNPLEPLNRYEWTLNYSSSDDIAKQQNGYDCGVFICLFTALLLQDKCLLFTQVHVNEHVREKIALSLLKGKLIQ